MREKVFFGIVFMVLLVVMLFNGISVKAGGWAGTIKIGAIGPMQYLQGCGIEEGCHLAAEQINLGPNGVDEEGNGDDGIVVGGLNYKVKIVRGDTSPIIWPHPPTHPNGGVRAAMELVAAGVDFVVGGFRTEANAFGAREVLMDYKKMFFITGAATNELVDDGTGADPNTVRSNYDRYKYVFRNTHNSTTLLYSTANFAAYVMQTKLIPVFGTPVKTAVISEASMWADKIHSNLANQSFWSSEFGLPVSVVYDARIGFTQTDFEPELIGVKASGAQLLIEVISGSAGRNMIKQWDDVDVKALLVGIDMEGQEVPLHWLATGGKCEYEAFLANCGQETPIFARTVAFWDTYVAKYGHAPIYTSYSAYDAVIAIEQVIEAAGIWPMTSDEMVSLFESLVRDDSETVWDYSLGDYHPNVGILGKFKYTQYHDLFCNELGPTWEQGYARPLVAQWQAGRLEVVWPLDQPYSKEYKIPPWMPPPPPEYTLRIYSSPTRVTFTVDGVSHTTPWSGTYSEGTSVSLVMPETHNGCVWFHWLEDGDTNRTKTVTMDTNITLTAVYACIFDVVLDDIHYPVSILSNSTVSDFNFNQTEMQISFDVTGGSGTTGYCNVTIPKNLLTGSPWTIKIDNTSITDFDEKTNNTHTFLYFTYTHESPLQVTIKGTSVVPEFPSAIILPLLMILSLTTVVFVKLKKKKQ